MGVKNWFKKSGNIISIAILIMGLLSIGTSVYLVKKSNDLVASKNAQLSGLNKKLNDIQKNNSSNLQKINQEMVALRDTNNVLRKELNQSNNKLSNAKKKVQALATSRSIEHTYKTIHVVATAYIAKCDTGCSGITRTGIDVTNTTHINNKRIVAVDTSIIPLHSILKITTSRQGTFYAEAEDTGGAIVGNRIDVLMSSNSQAIDFGRQDAKVEILREGA